MFLTTDKTGKRKIHLLVKYYFYERGTLTVLRQAQHDNTSTSSV